MSFSGPLNEAAVRSLQHSKPRPLGRHRRQHRGVGRPGSAIELDEVDESGIASNLSSAAKLQDDGLTVDAVPSDRHHPSRRKMDELERRWSGGGGDQADHNQNPTQGGA